MTTIKAKQRASVLWLLSKAYNNEMPTDLREPFYKDHEDNDRLKPQITQSLASAELYCLALANIYSDPNYNCLNHFGIMQILQRKGVYMVEPNDTSLTETVLIQTAPIKMSAHMVIIEAIMTLYIKEVLIPDKVAEVVARFSYLEEDEIPDDLEEVAIFWINKCCARLKQTMQSELAANPETRDDSVPPLHMVTDLMDLSDGCALAALLSFYCPGHLKWQDICISVDMYDEDSIYNIQLIQYFCEEKLPFDCCFLTIEDILFLHETIHTNVLAFIADLLFFFEIRPAECVRQPGLNSSIDQVDGEANNYLHYPELPTPAEMKAMSLQHSSWADHQVYQQPINGSPPTRPPRRLNSNAKLANHQKGLSSQQQPSDEDEELTRYFSTIDFKTENEASPEIVMINERNVNKMPLQMGPKSINPYVNNNIYQKDSNSDESDVHLSGSPQKSSNDYNNHEINDKSSSQLTDYYTQLAQNTTSTTTRRPNTTTINRTLNKSQQNLMQSSIVLGTDSPPLPLQQQQQQQSDTNKVNTSTFNKLNSKHLPSSPDTEPIINIAYMNKSDKTMNNNSNSCLPSVTNKSIQNTSNNNTFRKTNLSNNSVENMSVSGDQPFYLKENDNNSEYKSLLDTYNSRQNLQQLNKSDSIDSLLDENEVQSIPDSPTKTNSCDSDIASQVHNIRLKLEEKRRKIEHERLTAEEEWKNSRQNIGKEAFLRVVHKNGSQEVPNQPMPSNVLQNHHILTQQDFMSQQMVNHNQMLQNQNHMMNSDQMNRQLHTPHMVNHQMIAPEYMNQQIQVMNSQMLNHQNMPNPIQPYSTSQTYYIPTTNTLQQHNTGFYMNSTTVPMTSVPISVSSVSSISSQQMLDEFVQQQQQQQNVFLTQASAPKPMIGQTFRVNKQSKRNKSPDFLQHTSPARSVTSEYSDEGFNNYDKSNKSSSSNSTAKETDSLAGDNAFNPKEAFFISFDSDTQKPKPAKPGLKPKHVKQQQQIRRELKSTNNTIFEANGQTVNNSVNGQTSDDQNVSTSVQPKHQQSSVNSVSPGVGFVIGPDLVRQDLSSEQEMVKKKEAIMLQSLKRREQQESDRAKREQNMAKKREDERIRLENSERKREEERIKRQFILEQYRQRKATEEAEKNGGGVSSKDSVRSNSTLVLNRPPRQRLFQKPRPKSLHVSATNIQDYTSLDCNKSRVVDDTDACILMSSHNNMSRPDSAMSAKSSAFVSSPTNGSNVPPYMFSRFRGPPSDGASDAGSVYAEYTGPKLFVKPSQKSNKTLILNAINVVLAGAVNAETKRKVSESINSSDSKHYLILFRNAGLQFRAVYTYNPDREEVIKLYGTGPKIVTNEVIDKFYKYNSGSKSFATIQTKHLSVTIDAFIIHNNLWTGKKVIPKKDYL
ncbi:patronin-like [Oppia nitens]|uniref:patronin-like n=1 Tax=Oppia nitens TaxID=1686743 RepID=UPI0023DB1348|nr:patronin-like [Oppia nitens]